MAEAPRNPPLPSGYDEDFVNAVEDEVLCLICHLHLKEPVLTRCGHRFCKECLEEHFRRCGFVYIIPSVINSYLSLKQPSDLRQAINMIITPYEGFVQQNSWL